MKEMRRATIRNVRPFGISVVLLLVAALAASLLVGAKSAVAADVFGQNLISNGDAEAGKGSSNGYKIVKVPGWKEKGNFNVVKYGASGFPTSSDPGPQDRGQNFFAGGPKNASSSASQVIDVSAVASQIDTGQVTFDLSGYLGGFESQEDDATLTAIFEGENKSILGTSTIGPVTAAERSDQTGLSFRSSEGTVPIGSRQVKMVLEMTRTNGYYNDGYADNLSLVLTASGAT